jgi:hypothetical protein
MLDIREKFHRPIDEVLWRSLKEWRITIFCVLATTAAGFFTLFDQFPILWEELLIVAGNHNFSPGLRRIL